MASPSSSLAAALAATSVSGGGGGDARARVEVVQLDGRSLNVTTLERLSSGRVRIELSADAWERVKAGRAVVERVIERREIVYGINTGFGKFADVLIEDNELAQLQFNLIVSHAAGVGTPLPPSLTRMMLALRINVLAKGHSGVRCQTLETLIDAFNKDCLSLVPEKGTVGASGDLAPLAHLALGLIGQGLMWHPEHGVDHARRILERCAIEPIVLQAKEGLALINGTQFITSITSLAAFRARRLAVIADIVGAFTVDVLLGTPRAFMPLVHQARTHRGQQLVASRLRSLLHTDENPSELYQYRMSAHNLRVQDSYTLRCIPQVHGPVHDGVANVVSILEVEMNSATDNPMIFAEDGGQIVSAGNFHGEYPAKAADTLAIYVHELANISERRIERLCNPDLSEGLPAFLVPRGGLNSGFMIAHCTAAALTSENKTLCHPASVDTIPTSAAKEDHVSMGGFAARKALQVVENVETVLAIELLASCQALDLRRPLRTTKPLEAVHKVVRAHVPMMPKDRYIAPDIDAVTQLIRDGSVLAAVRGLLPDELLVE